MRKTNETITLTKEQIKTISALLKEYIEKNLDAEISNMQSGFLTDFITEKIGAFYYNKAIADSLSFMTEKAEDLYLLMKDEE